METGCGMGRKRKKRNVGRGLLSLLMAGAGAAAALLAFLQKGALKLLMLRIWKHRRAEHRQERRARKQGVPAPPRRLLPEKLGVRRAGDPMPPWKNGRYYFNLSCILGMASAVLRIVAAVLDAAQGQERPGR